jgi:DmsE family decaheme c-type cytochrome
MRTPMLLAAGLLLLAPLSVLAGGSYLGHFEVPTDLTYVGAETCLDCHDDVGEFYAHSPHNPDLAKAVPGTGAYGCEACHGPGSLHVEEGGDGFILGVEVLGAMSEQQSADMCLQCHTGHGYDWPTSAHSGSGITCSDCHADQVHYGGKATPAGEFRNQAEFCVQCHADQVSGFRMPFRHRVLDGQMSCTDCHDPHAGFESRSWNGLNETCTGCHTEMTGPFVFEHEGVVTEECTACHQPHGSMHDKLLTQDGNTLCMQCHYDEGFQQSNLAIGDTPHGGMLSGEARCYDCHIEIHGSNVSSTFRN